MNNTNNKHRRRVSLIIICFFFWISCILCYPEKIYAESLTFSGLRCKTPEFKPYLEKGKFSYFLNQPATVTAEIQDKDFSLIRKLQFMKMEKAGENVILWDGKDDKNDFIKSGEYVLSVRAVGDSASAVAASMEMKIAFNAPKGTVLKEHVSQIEGKEKKEYPNEVPTKFEPKGCFLEPPLFILMSPLTLLLFLGAFFTGEMKDFFSIFTKPFFGFTNDPDYKKYEKIKQKIDEHNAKIDSEIVQNNCQIDNYNQKIKDSIILKIAPIE